MVRLRRVRIDAPGWSRRRAGRGFVYLDLDKVRIVDEEHLERITTLAIPPAWREVWISPWPNGHIQAAGLDDAERRQYLYHQQWTLRRGRLKHDHVLDVARRLPAARRRVRADLALDGMPKEKVLALAFRLLDLAYLRVGGEGYALAARLVRSGDAPALARARPGARERRRPRARAPELPREVRPGAGHGGRGRRRRHDRAHA